MLSIFDHVVLLFFYPKPNHPDQEAIFDQGTLSWNDHGTLGPVGPELESQLCHLNGQLT